MKKLISMLFMAVLTAFTMTGCDDEESVMQKFTVTFDSQGGSEVAAQAVYAGEKIVKPADPTKEKEFFVDWYKEAECTNAWDFENETVSQDITLYAKWASVAYTVTFESNGGSAVEAQQVVEGKFATKPQPVPTKDGYLFTGWYTEQTMSNLFDFYTPITKDITLYAKWLDIASITYNDLNRLFNEAQNLVNYPNYTYTEESLKALKVKVEEVRPVAENPSATQAQIAEAYQTLYNAMQELVELPYRPTASLQIYPTPIAEGVVPVYLATGNFNLDIIGLDSNGNPSTRPDITFEFDGNEMAKWGEYYYYGASYLSFSINPNLKSGTTIQIKVICNDVPSLSTTITLKAISAEEQKAQFIDAVNALPETITFDNYLETIKAANQANELYWQLQNIGMGEDTEVKAANDKLQNEIFPKLWYFTYYDYKFEGNTFIGTIAPYNNTTEKYEYKANGNFPCGTYTGEWIYDEYNNFYYQNKMELKSDNTYQTYWRNANSKEEQETAEWSTSNSGKYKVSGDQKAGGTLILQAQ